MNGSKILFLVLACCMMNSVTGQEETRSFFIRPTVGIAGAQIDGDNYAGYNKAGIYGGCFVGRKFGEKFSSAFGLTFIQKGARKNQNIQKGDYEYYRINLNYVEVPVNLEWKLKLFRLYGGFFYSRLISYRESNQFGDLPGTGKYRNADVGYVLGGEREIRGGFSLGVRFSYSVKPIYYYVSPIPYRPGLFSGFFNKGLYNNLMVFYFHYEISPRKKTDAE